NSSQMAFPRRAGRKAQSASPRGRLQLPDWPGLWPAARGTQPPIVGETTDSTSLAPPLQKLGKMPEFCGATIRGRCRPMQDLVAEVRHSPCFSVDVQNLPTVVLYIYVPIGQFRCD